jgi:asparagine synthase (glutamine-hydrolysing)
MCGICGLLQLAGKQPISLDMLGRMSALISHRGPDDHGIYVSPDKSIGLANRRLAIIDPSDSGRQPFRNEDGTIWVVYNGETYNYAEIRNYLQGRGHQFHSNTDTEIIVHLYEEYGVDCVQHMRGMFAFALWDQSKRQLFLARDRLGIKPLYYAYTSDAFLFASEIKCLLTHPKLKRAVNDEALYHYLTFLTTPAPQTLFKGVFKLPSGHRAIINSDSQIHVEEYWDVFSGSYDDSSYSEADQAERVVSALRESVKLRMVSDVPFGALLSGGMDSSTNVSLMAAEMDRPVQTFSIGYKGNNVSDYNEINYARQVADKFGAEHHEILIGRDDLIRFLPKLVYHQDEPIADPVCVPLYYVCKLAKDNGTSVVQVGEGADELFGGYWHWKAVLRLMQGPWQAFGALPSWARHLTLKAASPMINDLRTEYLRRGAVGEEMFWGGAIAFGEDSKRNILTDEALSRIGDLSSHEIIQKHRRNFDDRCPSPDYLKWMSYLDLHMRLPELLLMRVDKMSMATSVEARVPFLDHEFVQLVMSISQSQKVPGLRTKHLLKQAVQGLIPDHIINREKQGFRVPIGQWFSDTLGLIAEQKLRDFCQRTDYFRWSRVSKLVYTQDELVWYLLNFVLWYELWIEGIPSEDLIPPS